MRNLTQAFKSNAQKFWNDEEAQGMIEYILILVAVVAIVTVAGRSIKGQISAKAGDLGDKISGFDGDAL
jgi:Flp pilus assembly pilin Flp